MIKVHGVELIPISNKHVYTTELDKILKELKEKRSFLDEKLNKFLTEFPMCKNCEYLQVFFNVDFMEMSVCIRLYSASPLNDIKGNCCFTNTNKQETKEQVNNPLEVQEGGNHYRDFTIQPIEFIYKNNIPFIEANVIKYVCRHKKKNGIEDLKKAKHYLELLAFLEYNEKI